jgi:hypothetical protein
VSSPGVKPYEVEGFYFEFSPNGSPYVGVLLVTEEGAATYTAEVTLTKAGSRKGYAAEANRLFGMDAERLARALAEVCTLRWEEIAAAKQAEEAGEECESGGPKPETVSQEAEVLISSAGVLDRFVEDVAHLKGVVRDRDALRLQALVAVGAQLAPLPNGKPAGANLILTAEAGRGKNYICDAVASALPEEFYLAFESASAKSFYYRAESDPTVLKHRWIYPNEAEATDQLVEMFRPLLSGGKASHLTVNKDAGGRNAAQELSLEGPASITIPTVRNKLDGQLQTRMLVAELPDYAGRVAEHSRALSRQLLPAYSGEDYTPLVQGWQAALRSLTAVRRVVFPLDSEAFTFDSDTVSHGARLWGNLLGLMLSHAWLEQHNREVMELEGGQSAVLATPEDYEAAYTIFQAVCERSVINLSDTHRKILGAVYSLKEEADSSGSGANFSAEGFSHRKIADRAGVHHSTVGEQRTFLTKSVKLLRETEGGSLTLVADAEPSWWGKGEVLAGFPRPEQVWRWWDEGDAPAPETARQPRQPSCESHNPDTYAEKGGGQSIRQQPDTIRHPEDSGLSGTVAGRKPAVADGVPATENGIGKPSSDDPQPVADVAGGFEEGEQHRNPDPLSFDLRPGESATLGEVRAGRENLSTDEEMCKHGLRGGKGCYLCDPKHPYRLASEATT